MAYSYQFTKEEYWVLLDLCKSVQDRRDLADFNSKEREWLNRLYNKLFDVMLENQRLQMEFNPTELDKFIMSH